MIADLDNSIKNFIDQYSNLGAEVGVVFGAPTKDKLAELFYGGTNFILNVYLYKISENLGLRETEWKKVRNPDGTVTTRPPMPQINCSYIITAWSKDTSEPDSVFNEHAILSEVMPILLSFPELPQDILLGSLIGKEVHTAALLSDDVKSPGEFWTALENHLKPFLHYVVTIPITPVQVITAKEMVTSITARTKLTNASGLPSPERHIIGGQAFWTDASVSPAARIAVAAAAVTVTQVDGTGTPIPGGIARQVNADAEGYFIFKNLPTGRYKFEADADGFAGPSDLFRVVPPALPDQDDLFVESPEDPEGGRPRLYEIEMDPL